MRNGVRTTFGIMPVILVKLIMDLCCSGGLATRRGLLVRNEGIPASFVQTRR